MNRDVGAESKVLHLATDVKRKWESGGLYEFGL